MVLEAQRPKAPLCKGQDFPRRGEMSPQETERREELSAKRWGIVQQAVRVRRKPMRRRSSFVRQSLSLAYGDPAPFTHTRPQAGVRERNRQRRLLARRKGASLPFSPIKVTNSYKFTTTLALCKLKAYYVNQHKPIISRGGAPTTTV